MYPVMSDRQGVVTSAVPGGSAERSSEHPLAKSVMRDTVVNTATNDYDAIRPLPWPTGLPAPGYVPKTNPLNGRWVTVTGGDAEFIKKSIASGMLGGAEASKIQAGNYQSDECSCSSGSAVLSFNVGLHDLDDDVSCFSDFGSCVDACTSRVEYSVESTKEAEAAAEEGEAVDFPDGRGSGRVRLVSTPLWSLRSLVCPLWLIIGKAAQRDEGERYADDRDAFAAQEERCSSWRRARRGGVVTCGVVARRWWQASGGDS